jgi:two-component system response regulator BaeR
MKTQRILIAEDDQKIAFVLKDYLQKENFKVTVLHRGDKVMLEFLSRKPSVILLDIRLPGQDGMKVLKKIRAVSTVPILLVTAKTEEGDRLLGLEMGADDYICKPFLPQEVVARVKAVLRRVHSNQTNNLVASGSIVLDVKNNQAFVADSKLLLTPIEFDLLRILLSRPGQVFTRNDLISSLQKKDFDAFERTIDSHICNLRRKIAAHLPGMKLINTIYSVGYLYIPETES